MLHENVHLREGLLEVFVDRSDIRVEEFSYRPLRKPNGFGLDPDLEPCRAVSGLVRKELGGGTFRPGGPGLSSARWPPGTTTITTSLPPR